jgi:hypothetical protein
MGKLHACSGKASHQLPSFQAADACNTACAAFNQGRWHFPHLHACCKCVRASKVGD